MMLRIIYWCLALFLIPLLPFRAVAGETVTVNEYHRYNGDGNAAIEQIASGDDYELLNSSVVNLGLSKEWKYLKFHVRNESFKDGAFYYLNNPGIGRVQLFQIGKDGSVRLLGKDGAYTPYNQRQSETTSFLFNLDLPVDEEAWYLMRVSGEQQIIISGMVGTELDITRQAGYSDNKIYIYAGIIVALIVYNFFLAFSTRDPESFYYILYLISVGLVQLTNSGVAATSIWPNSEWLSVHSVHLFGLLSGIFTMVFAKKFIRTRKYTPIIDRIINVYIVISVIALFLVFADKLIIVYNILNFNAASAFILLLAGIIAIRKGSITARYFIVAWSIFLVSVTVFALKDFGILPYNTWTVNSVMMGSALEGVLLSFAIANKINILKKQKEEANAELLKTVRNQNELLEIKVKERTEELEEAKDKIQTQFDHLRLTQKKLIESEKMAGLGQMTAGIAHELNNPINFVSSNIAPLHRDMQDLLEILDDYAQLGSDFSADDLNRVRQKYDKLGIDFLKKEIDALMKGIEEGSRRTAEIVRGLRVFARTDKDELINANLNDCLQSTLIVMKNVIKGKVTLTKDIDPLMPSVYCFPGKLNQVIVNLVTNAIQATDQPGRDYTDRLVHVKSYFDEENIYLSVKDNGCGIDDVVMKRIFMPFFTTKEVGEGTGLGLSITMGIIEEHQGHIEVKTKKGEGTEFIIHLPRVEQRQTHSAA